MVEGPKVVIKCQRLQCLRGQTLLLVAVQGKNSSLDAFQSMLHTKVSDVFSIGKELFLAFVNSPLVIRLHFGMSGSERISLTNSPLPATKPDLKSRKKLSFVLTLCKNTVSFLDCTIVPKPLFMRRLREVGSEEILCVLNSIFVRALHFVNKILVLCSRPSWTKRFSQGSEM